MRLRSVTRRLPILSLAALLPSAFAATVSVDQLAMEREAVQLMRQLEEVGRNLRYNAGRLHSVSNYLQTSKWTHIHHLDEIKSLVNEGLRPALDRLVEIQPHLPEWKRQSIDRVLGAAKALAADTESAILAKRDAGTLPPAMNAEYKGLVARIHEHAEVLVKTSDASVSYAAARLKAHEAGLTVPNT